MKALSGILAAGLCLAAAAAYADTPPDNSSTAANPPQANSSSSHKHMMQDCMKRMAAKGDGSTHAQMKASCKSEIKDGVVNDGVVTQQMKKAESQ